MSQTTYPYAKMLSALPALDMSNDDVEQLAAHMTQSNDVVVPSGYTYFGQFVNHDITLELSATKGTPVPSGGPIQPNEVANYRSPFLNLDSLYGEEGVEQNGFTAFDLRDPNDPRLMRLGDTVPPSTKLPIFRGKDLPRVPGQSKAMLVEARNDENLVVAQTHLLFLRFHNVIVRKWLSHGVEDPFEEARQTVIQHYQWIILNDYLPLVLNRSVLSDVMNNPSRFYHGSAIPFVPLEFSVAAFRLGHSMIRDSYNWNKIFNHSPGHEPASLFDLQTFVGDGTGLIANKLPSDWAINWNWFYRASFVEQGNMLNEAAPIDTRLAKSLKSLAATDLFRGRAHQLPSGQAVAEVMLEGKSGVLPPEQIEPLLPQELKAALSAETPLWFYLLAEAEIQERGRRFGQVGSRIVAETIVELIRNSTPSILNNGFEPKMEWRGGKGEFGMLQLLNVVADGDLGELDPLAKIEIK